jgi:hypothetical protein
MGGFSSLPSSAERGCLQAGTTTRRLEYPQVRTEMFTLQGAVSTTEFQSRPEHCNRTLKATPSRLYFGLTFHPQIEYKRRLVCASFSLLRELAGCQFLRFFQSIGSLDRDIWFDARPFPVSLANRIHSPRKRHPDPIMKWSSDVVRPGVPRLQSFRPQSWRV